jgi:hypothetical protein
MTAARRMERLVVKFGGACMRFVVVTLAQTKLLQGDVKGPRKS